MPKEYVIDPKEFKKAERVDAAYIAEFKKQFKKTKATLPQHLDFYGYKIMEEGKYFNGRFIAGGIKPRFITPVMEAHAKKRTETYFKVLKRLRDLLRDSKELQQYFNLTDVEIKLLSSETGFDDPVVFGRFDSVLTPEDGLRVYELNTNCAATPGWVEMLGNTIEDFPFWDSFQKKHNISYYNHWYRKLRAGIMKQYKAWGGKDTHPPILMLRWPGQYNQDSDMICQALQRLGHHCVVGDVTQVQYRNGKLTYHGTQYDFVLRWFDMDHLIHEVGPLYQDLMQASYDNAVCIVNPLSASVLAHKALFAFFTDEQFDQYITKK